MSLADVDGVVAKNGASDRHGKIGVWDCAFTPRLIDGGRGR